MSNISGASMPGCPALIPMRSQQQLSQPCQREAMSLCRQQIPAAGAQSSAGAEGLSLLPDTSARHSQAFASVPVMV